jgi:hypothetical protein
METTDVQIEDLNSGLAQLQAAINDIVKEEVLPVFVDRVHRHTDYLGDILDLWHRNCDQLPSTLKAKELWGWYHAWKNVSDKLSETNSSEGATDFETSFSGLLDKLHRECTALPRSVRLEQFKERFERQAADPLALKLRKTIKGTAFHISRLPHYTFNVFRSSPKPIRYWGHDVPLQDLVTCRLRESLLKGLIALSLDATKLLVQETKRVALLLDQSDQGLHQIWRSQVGKKEEAVVEEPVLSEEAVTTDNSATQEEVRVEEFVEALPQNLFDLVSASFEAIRKEIPLAGTMEMPVSQFGPDRNVTKTASLTAQFDQTILRGKERLTYAQNQFAYEAWLKRLQATTRIWLFDLQNSVEPRYFDPLHGWESQIAAQIEEMAAALSTQKVKDLPAWLEKVRPQYKEEIVRKLVEPARAQLAQSQIPSSLGGLLDRIKAETQNLNGSFSVLNEQKNVVKIDLNRLVEKDLSHQMEQGIAALRSFFIKESVILRQNLAETGQTTLYILDVAGDALEMGAELADKTVEMAEEGFVRAREKITFCQEETVKLQEGIDEGAVAAVLALLVLLSKLQEISAVEAMRLKLVRRDIKSSSQTITAKSKNFLLQKYQELKTWTLKWVDKSLQLYEQVRVKLGLASPPDAIEAEISEFLTETSQAISQLPFVYQRLFALEPVNDASFFAKRQEDLALLNKAYQSWQKTGISSVAVIGELRGGKTSLLNMFFDQDNLTHPGIRLESPKRVLQLESLSSLIAEGIGWKSAPEPEKLAARLLNLRKPRIIALDPLEMFYLREVGGLHLLGFLVDLISQTSAKIFWIIASSVQSWHYLNKVMALGDYFKYMVELSEMEGEDLEKIILQRHGFSGYKLEFLPGKAKKTAKNYQKLSPEEKQAVLKTEYFNNLKFLSGKNLSVAFLFWLRSVKESADNTLKVNSLKEVNLRFLDSLPVKKLISIHYLLQHDGLTLAEYARLYRKSMELSRLELWALVDDGIVLRQDSLFVVNPLLLSLCIRQLRSKNFLH